jgi:hypothetical protein
MKAAAERTPAELAAAFLSDVGCDPRPWRETFQTWAAARDLTALEQYEVRVAILRTRVFGAVERSASNARSRGRARRR